MEIKKHNRLYYEGILQLRNPSIDAVPFVRKLAEKDSAVTIAKVRKVKNGFDVYVSSNAFLAKLAKILQGHFGGEIKRSSELHSVDRQTSKKKFRGTLLFRQPNFKKGDIITLKGEDIEIISFGRKVFGRYMKNGKKVLLRYNQIDLT